ncbi:MAG: methyltransferase [Parachlamydiales bacterium]|jgi:23S rRNA (uracil1939-C5)-methyltransferase
MSEQPITEKVAAWAFGGAGILRHEGLAVFVPYSCVGDIIECSLTKKKKNFAEGTLLKIISPSPQRIQPLCPVYTRCGGCQLQHVSYPEQLAYKQQTVIDALTRIGKFSQPLVYPTVPAPVRWQYRRHITLHLSQGKLGYLENDNTALIEPSACLLFSEDETLFPYLRKLFNKSPDGRVTLIKSTDKLLMDAHFASEFSSELVEEISHSPFFSGGRLRSATQENTFGSIEGSLTYEDLTFSFHLGAFLQNHPEQSAAIYRALCNEVSPLKPTKIIDLYSGIGITSCLFSQLGASVECIEYSPAAVKAAKANLKKYAQASWNVIEGPVERLLRNLKGPFDLAFVNPPRTGMHPSAIQQLLKHQPEHLFYLSCMPSTLARDLQLLSSRYRLIHCTPFDLFPQTAHVETLARLQLISK